MAWAQINRYLSRESGCVWRHGWRHCR